MKIQKHVKVELLRKKAARPIEAVQYDTGNQIIFELIDFDLPTGTTATLYIQKPSGKFVYQEDGIAIADNEITVDLHNQALTEHGKVYYQVRLENAADLITTFTGLMFVEKSLADAGATESRTVLAAFAELTAEKIAEIQAAAAREMADQLAAIQQKSEAEQAAIRNTGAEVLNTIPADYTATAAMVEEMARTKAPGIVCAATGEMITVNDASDMPLQGLKLFGKTEQVKTTGKNLFDVSRIADTNNVKNNNGVLTVTAPSTASSVTANHTLGELAPSLAVGSDYILTFNTTGNSQYIYLAYGANKMWTSGNTQTITQEMLDSEVMLYASGVSTTAVISDMMIRPASVTDATYEPYTGGAPSPSPDYPQPLVSVGDAGSITARVCGKNLIQPSENAVFNGVTKTVNADGSITVKGTATADTWLRAEFYAVGGKEHILTGCPGTGSSNTYTQYVNVNSRFYYDYGKGVSFTPEKSGRLQAIIQMTKGFTIDATFYQMVRLADTDATYEPPYTAQTLTAQTPNGLAGIGDVRDEVDFERGVYIKRIGTVDAGTLNYGVNVHTFYAQVSDAKIGIANNVCLCDSYSVATNTTGGTALHAEGDLIFAFGYANNYVYFANHAYTDAAAFKASMSGVMLCYELATPIETALTAEEIAAFRALHSNKPNTIIHNDADTGMKVKYVADTKLYIDNKFAQLAARLIENT